MPQALLDRVQVVEEIGEDDDQAAMRELLGELIQDFACAGLVPARNLLQFVDLPASTGPENCSA